MRKLLKFLLILFLGVISSACINNYAVYELNELAHEHLRNGDVDGAIARLVSSVDLDPNHYETRYTLAMAYMQKDICDEALLHATVAFELIEKEPAIYKLLAEAYMCTADMIYEKKLPDGTIEKIVYDSPPLAVRKAGVYVDYLKKSNSHFDEYTRLLPSADDIHIVKDKMRENQQKIDVKVSEYGKILYGNNSDSAK